MVQVVSYTKEFGVQIHQSENEFAIFSKPSNGVPPTLHREDGPAVSFLDGSDRQRWYIEGTLHRVGGPAIITLTGEHWYRNGKLHRLDGPAVRHDHEWDVEYHVNGEYLTEEEYMQFLEERNFFPLELRLISRFEFIRKEAQEQYASQASLSKTP
jgi:hypothetical protein